MRMRWVGMVQVLGFALIACSSGNDTMAPAAPDGAVEDGGRDDGDGGDDAGPPRRCEGTSSADPLGGVDVDFECEKCAPNGACTDQAGTEPCICDGSHAG